MLKINAERLKNNIETLGQIGGSPEGGVNRFTYSDEYDQAINYLRELMSDAGLSTTIDTVGNLIGLKKGPSERILMIGSHVDSVPNAGIFDGCLGVLAGIEVMQTLKENDVRLNHTVMVTSWAEEEGSCVTGVFGSSAFAGCIDTLPDPVLEKLKAVGLTMDDVKRARYEGLNRIDASMELHIEQGGMLEQESLNIGVVDGIVGIERYIVTMNGVANHAGTTPMSLRDDALIKACKLILELEQLARDTDQDMVYTVGWLNVPHGAENVIPGEVVFCVEVRSMKIDAMHAIRDCILSKRWIGQCTLKTVFQQAPVPMSDVVKGVIEKNCRSLGLTSRHMNSGAGHDTMVLAEKIKHCGMIFVPSVGGVSHCPQEWTEWEDTANGANVLLNALLDLDATDSNTFD